MTRHLIAWTLLWLTTASPLIAQTRRPSGGAVRTFTVSEPVFAGGAALAPGTYELRVVTAGETTSGSIAQRAVEIVADGKVVAHEIAEMVPVPDSVGTSGNPSRVRVEKLKEGDFVRVSFVEGIDRYLIYLPTGK